MVYLHRVDAIVTEMREKRECKVGVTFLVHFVQELLRIVEEVAMLGYVTITTVVP